MNDLETTKVAPTMKTDYPTRVYGFVSLEEAQVEATLWRILGYSARIVTHLNIHNVLVSKSTHYA